MSVDIVYRCDGCEAVRRAVSVRREYDVVVPGVIVRDGEAWDKVAVRTPTIESAAPSCWMVWDPYTSGTYCPDCWDRIQGGVA